VQYGLVEEHMGADLLRWWRGMIFGIQGQQCGEVFYNFVVDVPAAYPAVPPVVRFTSPKIAMDCVDAGGYVNINRIAPGFRWTQRHNIADVLTAIRENMKRPGVSKDSYQLQSQSYAANWEPWK
jgi:ubiquitin-protein ligase